jgi:hypothetical protein
MRLPRRLIPLLFAALFASAPLGAVDSVTSQPVGIVCTDVPAGLSGVQFPIIPSDALASTVAGQTDMATGGRRLQGIVFMSTTLPSSVLAAGTSYYLEITSGPLEGERFEVDEALTATATPGVLVIDLDDANTTQSTLLLNALTGAKAAIRPHMTLTRLQARVSPALVGSNVASQADGVMVFTALSAVTYYLRADGVTWRKAGSTADFAHMIIAPDQSIMLQMRSGAKELRQEGLVRANAFRINMKTGVQSAATGFPESLSPVEFGATANSLAAPQTTWTGSNQQSLADGIMVFDPTKGSFVTYYMRADGLTWRAAGSTTDLSLSKILKHDSFMMIKRKNPDDKAFVPRPF